jgi:hypothetical protein
MDHSTWAGYRMQQQQQQEQAREHEVRARIAERTEAQRLGADAPAAEPARARGWQALLVRAHVVRPLTH